MEGVEGPAVLREPGQLRAAGDDAHPRARRLADRRVRPRAAHLRADQHHPENGAWRVPVGRGPTLLRAWRPRLRRHRPRSVENDQQSRRPGRRCLDHHPAGRQELPAHQRAQARAQDQGSDPGGAHRAGLFQGQDPRALPQRDLPRARLLRRGGGLAQLLQQGTRRSGTGGGGLSRSPAQGAEQLPSLQEHRARHRAAQLDPRPDGRERLHQEGRRRKRSQEAAGGQHSPVRRPHFRSRILCRGSAARHPRPVWRREAVRWWPVGAHHARSADAALRPQGADRRPHPLRPHARLARAGEPHRRCRRLGRNARRDRSGERHPAVASRRRARCAEDQGRGRLASGPPAGRLAQSPPARRSKSPSTR